MRVKIRGGTASNGEPSLCLTCRFATVVKGASLRDEIVECSLSLAKTLSALQIFVSKRDVGIDGKFVRRRRRGS
jgi:hypothetical protein